MKSNRNLISAALVRIGGPALLLCVLCLGISARGFAEEKPQPTTSPWAIQVEPVQADEGQLPPDFSMATYENLIAQLVKTEKFQEVFRSGDHQAEGVPNLLVLHMTLLNFERGNQTKRAVTTVAGATKVQVHLKVSTRDGRARHGTHLRGEPEGQLRFGQGHRRGFAGCVASRPDQRCGPVAGLRSRDL
jgi:hypothetical protein